MRTMLNALLRPTGFHLGTPIESLKAQYSTPESSFLEAEGMQVHYRVTGDGPPLLLIHGIGSSLHTWEEWHDLLSAHYTVISLDIPGFGLTGAPPSGDYSIELYNRVFNRLLDHLGYDQCYMAGNSLGGFLTWNFALHHPERLLGAALLNAAGLNTTRNELADVGFILAMHPLTRGLTHVLTPRSMIRSSLINTVRDRTLVTEKMVTRYHDLLMCDSNRKSFSIILNELIITGEDNIPKLMQIDVPTLIQWGVHDNLINVRFAYQFHEALKHSELIIYESAGHLPMEEIPQRSAEDLHRFFQSLSIKH